MFIFIDVRTKRKLNSTIKRRCLCVSNSAGLQGPVALVSAQINSKKYAIMEFAGLSRRRAGCDVCTGVTLRWQFASRNNHCESLYDESQYFFKSTKVYSREKGDETRDKIQERNNERERKKHTKCHRIKGSGRAKIALRDSKLKIIDRTSVKKIKKNTTLNVMRLIEKNS